ncbi:MAG TPA: TIGR03435 family protein [Verrucomicrobiae bacterium]|jgi:uncharacterized protein (TIGR03435 family)|nr:TIGR03435 family protein [Verrucomicrobiae bacterium]
MKKTYLALAAGVSIFAAAAVAMGGNGQSAHIDNSWFNSGADELRQLPADLAVLRPTQHSHDYAKIRHYSENDTLARTMGRNVTLRQVIGEAYDCAPAQVILPDDAPQGRFDFLVTTSGDAREQLRNLIQTEFHYTANPEIQNVEVFTLTVSNPALPGFAVSATDETSDVNYAGGRLYFTHQPVSRIIDGLSQGLNRLVLDQTGLTNNYDYSFTWNHDIGKAMENSQWGADGVRKALANRGLALESGNISTNMYVVTRTQ